MVTIEYNDSIAPITNILQPLFYNLQGIIPLIHCRAMWSLTRASAKHIFLLYLNMLPQLYVWMSITASSNTRTAA